MNRCIYEEKVSPVSQNIEVFGKYILFEKIAAGGMAEVFLARSNGAGGITKFVAIKRILPQYSDNPDFIKMFKEEAKIAINLSHSNVVSIFDFGIENSQFFLVMDYVEGKNLRQILNKMKKTSHKFTIDQVVYMVKEVAAGLDHAHRCLDGSTGKPLNITHRDMSPQNIMVNFEGEIKIIDFGIAKAENQMESTKAGTLKGKFGYMSPEQAEGQAVDLRTDIFSLGIVLWELLANDRLFISNNEINTLRKIRDCQIPSLRKINPNISPELETIVQKALARDRNLRYQTGGAFHRDLNRFLNRSYPDFSHQDFSVFIKTLYADEILNLRKRLVGYANSEVDISSKSNEDEDRTVVTTTEISRSGYEFDSTNTGSEKTEHDYEYEEVSQYEYVEESVLDEEALEESMTNANIKADDYMDQTRTNFQHTRTSATGFHQPHEFTRNSHGHNLSQISREKPKFSVVSILAFIAVLVGGYFVLKTLSPKTGAKVDGMFAQLLGTKPQSGTSNMASEQHNEALVEHHPSDTEEEPRIPAAHKPYLEPQKQQVAKPTSAQPSQKWPSVEDQEQPVKPETTLPPSSQPQAVVPNRYVNVAIKSNPSGAEIYINGKPTRQTTPKIVPIPRDIPFTLALKKENHINFTQDNVTFQKIGKSFMANLEKAVVGYLDIDVIPARNAKVFINGKPLNNRQFPVYRYSVPALTAITVKAINPNGKKAVREITLNKHERKSITLRLKSRHPSQAP